MRFALAQISSNPEAIEANIQKHLEYITNAHSEKADVILFPELSLTGYEPKYANKLALDKDAVLFEPFQNLADKYEMDICVGYPEISNELFHISMNIFSKGMKSLCYRKQYLHPDELEVFTPGKTQVDLITTFKIQPSICYELSRDEHRSKAIESGAKIYASSVAKSREGMINSYNVLSNFSSNNSIYSLICNAVGYNDNFLSTGHSGAWDKSGNLMASLTDQEDLLIVDIDDENHFFN